MSRPMIPGWVVLLFTAWGIVGAASGSDLTIGIGADVTAIDPHYHNVTPNNNVAAHIFGYLVLRDERSEADSRARRILADDRPADLGVQAAQRRQIP